MGIRDAQNRFSDAQDITADAVGENVIDLSADRSIGVGEPMAVVFNITTAASQTNSDEDYAFEVEYSSNAAQSTGRQRVGSRLFESGTPDAPAQNADLLVEGFQFVIPVPPVTKAESEQFIGIRTDVTGTDPTVSFTADLVPMSMIQNDEAYADAITIS